jgi:hypothetical protein
MIRKKEENYGEKLPNTCSKWTKVTHATEAITEVFYPKKNWIRIRILTIVKSQKAILLNKR